MADNSESLFYKLMHGVRDTLGFDPSSTVNNVPARTDFPSMAEVPSARSVNAAYGSAVDPMVSNQNARVRSLPLDSAVDAYNRGAMGDTTPPTQGDMPWMDPKVVAKMPSTEGRVTRDTQDALYQSYLAAQRSALAYLGFDPRHMITTPKGDYKTNVVGAYFPNTDTVWTQAEYAPSNPVHESMHRGMQILRENQTGDNLLYPERTWNMRDPEQLIPPERDEEDTVRQMMYQKYGPVERDQQAVDKAKWQLGLKNEYGDRLKALEKMAADLIAKRHPAGPR